MRIVAGTARGRTLHGPKPGQELRPTADRVRQALFDIVGPYFDGERVLDLFAGTGALGLEALSRGAARAVLVDVDGDAAELCRVNASALGFAERAEVRRVSAERAIRELAAAGQRFELVFADPPYALHALLPTAEAAPAVLAPGGLVVIEHDKREEAPEQVGALAREDQRRFGDTRVTLYRGP